MSKLTVEQVRQWLDGSPGRGAGDTIAADWLRLKEENARLLRDAEALGMEHGEVAEVVLATVQAAVPSEYLTVHDYLSHQARTDVAVALVKRGEGSKPSKSRLATMRTALSELLKWCPPPWRVHEDDGSVTDVDGWNDIQGRRGQDMEDEDAHRLVAAMNAVVKLCES